MLGNMVLECSNVLWFYGCNDFLKIFFEFPQNIKMTDVNECTSGVHGCVAVEQVCYNLVGSHVCINVDGSFSAPGPASHQGSSPGSLSAEPRQPGLEISNEVAQGRSPFISGSGALGVQGFPGANRELGLLGISHSQGRCPPGYSFNLERQACDGELVLNESCFSYIYFIQFCFP